MGLKSSTIVGSESYGGMRHWGLKIPWAETPVWVRIPPRVRISVNFLAEIFVFYEVCLYISGTIIMQTNLTE